jgi:hypothetical protein
VELHDEAGLAARRRRRVEDGDDVRVLAPEADGDRELAPEAGRRGVVGGVDDLDRDVAIKRVLAGAVDDPVATARDLDEGLSTPRRGRRDQRSAAWAIEVPSRPASRTPSSRRWCPTEDSDPFPRPAATQAPMLSRRHVDVDSDIVTVISEVVVWNRS